MEQDLGQESETQEFSAEIERELRYLNYYFSDVLSADRVRKNIREAMARGLTHSIALVGWAVALEWTRFSHMRTGDAFEYYYNETLNPKQESMLDQGIWWAARYLRRRHVGYRAQYVWAWARYKLGKGERPPLRTWQYRDLITAARDLLEAQG